MGKFRPDKITSGIAYSAPIVVCEAWCRAFEHVGLNAALLKAVHLALPKSFIYFVSQEAHGEEVKSRLASVGAAVPVSYTAIEVPKRNVAHLRQFVRECTICCRTLIMAQKLKANVVIWPCLRGSSLLALTWIVRILSVELLQLGILHGEVRSLVEKPPRRPWNRFLTLRSLLKRKLPSAFKLFVLGESIHAQLPSIAGLNLSAVDWLDHPYMPLLTEDCSAPHFPTNRPLRIGFLGASSKGFDKFVKIACQILAEHTEVEFIFVGFSSDKAFSKEENRFIGGISVAALTSSEYSARLASLDYCLWLGDSEQYRFTASASFLDMVFYGKPCIALRNAYIEHYFKIGGDIGHLCNTVDDVRAVVLEILDSPPTGRYAQQVANLLKLRELFYPSNVAPKLRQIISTYLLSRRAVTAGCERSSTM